jgi:hypothetical protein
VKVGLRIRTYGANDALETLDGESITLAPGQAGLLRWRLPDTGGQPIQQIGFTLSSDQLQANGTVEVDYLRWDGAPELRLRRPAKTGDFWRQAWINAVSIFSKHFPASFRISQSAGEGIIIHGTRQWTDYTVAAAVTVHLGQQGGLAVRVQGLRRYYALLMCADGFLRLVKSRDNDRTVLAETAFGFSLDEPHQLKIKVTGAQIECLLDDRAVFSVQDADDPYTNGGIGLVIVDGALSSPEVMVSA